MISASVPLGLAIRGDLGDGDAEWEGAAGVGGLDLNPEARLPHAHDLTGAWWGGRVGPGVGGWLAGVESPRNPTDRPAIARPTPSRSPHTSK